MIEQPAPITGLNFLESDETMQPTDAKVLDNWIPDAGFCRVRESGTVVVDLSGVF